MIINLNMSSSTPIYVQLRNEIVKGIASGKLKLGESLPTVRQMAEDLGVNTMTINKTYNILKIEGFIEIDRRHGAKVTPVLTSNSDFAEKLEDELNLLISESSIKGITKSDFLEMCSKIYDNMNLIRLSGGKI